MQPGDSVVVRQEVTCPDKPDLSLAGWQGRITEVEPSEDGPPTVGIEWDSLTIRAMPDEYVRECEIEGFYWTQMHLGAEQVDAARPRDTPAQTRKAVKEMAARHKWDYLEEEGARIQQVLSGVDPEDYRACTLAWAKHLKGVLTFPFDAEVSEFQEFGPLRTDDRVSVEGISAVDEEEGILVRVASARRTCDFLLADLEVVGERSRNYQPVRDYAVWFANR